MPPRRRHPTQLDRIEWRLDTAVRLLDAIARGEILLLEEGEIIMSDLSEITANVAKIDDAEASAVKLLGDLKARLDSAGTDPVALKALSDDLGSHADELAAAVVANTPSESPPEPPAA